jgi:hypothetical protein
LVPEETEPNPKNIAILPTEWDCGVSDLLTRSGLGCDGWINSNISGGQMSQEEPFSQELKVRIASQLDIPASNYQWFSERLSRLPKDRVDAAIAQLEKCELTSEFPLSREHEKNVFNLRYILELNL